MLVFTYVDQGLQLLIQQNLRTHVELWFYKQKHQNIINFQERYLQWGKRAKRQDCQNLQKENLVSFEISINFSNSVFYFLNTFPAQTQRNPTFFPPFRCARDSCKGEKCESSTRLIRQKFREEKFDMRRDSPLHLSKSVWILFNWKVF